VDLSPAAPMAIVPTLGALIPEWLLIIPRLRCSAVTELSKVQRNQVLRHLSLSSTLFSNSCRGVYFEHGSVQFGSASACGVDQAHVHSVGVSSAFATWVVHSHSQLDWREVDPTDPWRDIDGQIDYLLISDHVSAWVAEPLIPTSQYFRRRLASYLGREAEWDYRRFPFKNNARRTIIRFASDCRAS
jgi:hypothetical protein